MATARLDDPADGLLAAARRHDVVAVAAPAGRLDELTAAVVRRAPCPVLIARPVPGAGTFPAEVLFADDGTAACDAAARVVAALGARGAGIAILAPTALTTSEREVLARHVAVIRDAAALDPVLLDTQGPPQRLIPGFALELGSSLVVVGGSGAPASSPLAQVVARDAPCSVLEVLSPTSK